MKSLIIFLIIAGAVWYGYSYLLAKPDNLKPADSDSPASGICDFQEGDTVTAVINEDTPSPRCIKVLAGQYLRVENNTEQTVRVWFEGVSAKLLFPSSVELKPDTKHIFGREFGKYLEPGVHRLNTSLFSGPEIWLEQSAYQ